MHSNVDLSFDLFYLKMCRERVYTRPPTSASSSASASASASPSAYEYRSLTNYLSEQNFPNCRMQSINVTLSRKIGCFLILAESCLNVLKRATFPVLVETSVLFNHFIWISLTARSSSPREIIFHQRLNSVPK